MSNQRTRIVTEFIDIGRMPSSDLAIRIQTSGIEQVLYDGSALPQISEGEWVARMVKSRHAPLVLVLAGDVPWEYDWQLVEGD